MAEEGKKTYLQIGNRTNIAVVAIGSISLAIPMDKTLVLENCHYVPNFVANVISVSMLDKCGFYFNIKNDICSTYYGDDLYVNGYL